MTDSAVPASTPKVPTLTELFFAFLGIAASGFGGVLPFARRMLVEQRRWMNEAEFAEAFALCQFLPGPNIINLSVIIGSRWHGITGAVVAFFGLVAFPMLLMMLCGFLYGLYGEVPVLRDTLAGLAAGAAGLLIAMVAKMVEGLVRGGRVSPIVFVLIGFLIVGIARIPLYWAVLFLAPVSIAYYAWRPRR
jgi:chromate transporter